MNATKREPRVESVEVLDDHTVRLTFDDGLVGNVDLSHVIGLGPMGAPLEDPAYFRSVFVDEEYGTIAWPHGLDLAPEALYEQASRARVGP